MMVYGVSQSTWVERVLKFDRSPTGVLMIFQDRIGDVERERLVVSSESLLAAIMEPVAGGSTIECLSAAHRTTRLLDLEVRGNEVLLQVRGGPTVTDAAVGLDDFQDALERVLQPQ